MVLERLEYRACYGIPKPDCLVPRPRRDTLTVWRKGDRMNIARMALKCFKYRACYGVPEPDCPVA